MYISIATCNKLFEIMTPFIGDKIRPRLAVRAGDKTSNNSKTKPGLLHGHDQKTIPRQEQTRLGPTERF
jgi:hypothetical protein